MGDPPAQLREAVAAIDNLPGTHVLRESPLYGSRPWGRTNQPDFANMVIEISTQLKPHDLLRHAKIIEVEMGRKPGERWGPRPIDIDILLLDSERVSTSNLEIPHPRMWERAFVLFPLADLEPGLPTPEGLPLRKLLKKPEIAQQGVWPLESSPGNEQ
jgi:2-amino-4-hydroxy-6-hydroxymethyldihydropteridine diphosphokinase